MSLSFSIIMQCNNFSFASFHSINFLRNKWIDSFSRKKKSVFAETHFTWNLMNEAWMNVVQQKAVSFLSLTFHWNRCLGVKENKNFFGTISLIFDTARELYWWCLLWKEFLYIYCLRCFQVWDGAMGKLVNVDTCGRSAGSRGFEGFSGFLKKLFFSISSRKKEKILPESLWR